MPFAAIGALFMLPSPVVEGRQEQPGGSKLLQGWTDPRGDAAQRVPREQRITLEDARALVAGLRQAMADHCSYAHATDHDWTAALDRVAQQLEQLVRPEDVRAPAPNEEDPESAQAAPAPQPTIGMDALWSLCMGAIGPVGDGHLGLGASGMSAGPFLPVVLEGVGGAPGDPVVALRPNRRAFFASDYPYLLAIDGIPVQRWLDAAAQLSTRGTPHLERTRAIATLTRLELVRARLGESDASTGPGQRVRLTLGNDRGTTLERDVDLRATPPMGAPWPWYVSQRIAPMAGEAPGDIGYIRVTFMGEREGMRRDVIDKLEEYQDCAALILDVRGNGGGTRSLTYIIGPRVLDPDHGPLVFTAGRPLRQPGMHDELLHETMISRDMLPADDARWSPQEREAVQAFAQRFVPGLRVEDSRFGPWYYAVISPLPADHPTRIRVPLMILMDAGCFSATDVFLSAMKGISPRVVLVGEPSGGGSGYPMPHEVRGNEDGPVWSLRVSSMLSFQRDGRSFEHHGVHPDVLAKPLATDMLLHQTDAQLEAAIAQARAMMPTTNPTP